MSYPVPYELLTNTAYLILPLLTSPLTRTLPYPYLPLLTPPPTHTFPYSHLPLLTHSLTHTSRYSHLPSLPPPFTHTSSHPHLLLLTPPLTHIAAVLSISTVLIINIFPWQSIRQQSSARRTYLPYSTVQYHPVPYYSTAYY